MMYNKTNKLVENIMVGDKIMGDDKTERIVKKLHRGVEEMFEMYDEINNYEPDEPGCNCEEWPVWGRDGGYEDEGIYH